MAVSPRASPQSFLTLKSKQKRTQEDQAPNEARKEKSREEKKRAPGPSGSEQREGNSDH